MFRKNADVARAETASKNRTYEERRIDAECGAGLRRRTPEALDLAILAVLTAGPLMKWQLRDALHEPAEYIWRRLKVLKQAGSVRTVGQVLDQRAWALRDWHGELPTLPAIRFGSGIDRTRPAQAVPSVSWWIVPPEEFAAKAKAEAKRMVEAPAR